MYVALKIPPQGRLGGLQCQGNNYMLHYLSAQSIFSHAQPVSSPHITTSISFNNPIHGALFQYPTQQNKCLIFSCTQPLKVPNPYNGLQCVQKQSNLLYTFREYHAKVIHVISSIQGETNDQWVKGVKGSPISLLMYKHHLYPHACDFHYTMLFFSQFINLVIGNIEITTLIDIVY